MTDSSAVFGELTYLPLGTFYSDVAPLTDPHDAGALRARDQEMCVAYGPVISRRPFPGEFSADFAEFVDATDYVVVDFLEGRWRRQLGKDERPPRPAPVIKPRRRGKAAER